MLRLCDDVVDRRKFPLPERTVFLPSFETDKGGGGRKNDRFAYGSMAAMGVSTRSKAICGYLFVLLCAVFLPSLYSNKMKKCRL